MNLRALAVVMLVVSCAPPPPEEGMDGGPTPACQAGATRVCGTSDVGVCRKGTETCTGGAWSKTCVGAINPGTESCNGLDDDCDGTIDNGVGQSWYADADNDGFGTAVTVQVACTQPIGFTTTSNDCNDSSASINPSATETCDAALVDEDCDGTKNEGCACTLGMTVACCAGRGAQTCTDVGAGPMLSSCSVVAVAETCNGIDDDCDGMVDENACPIDAGTPDSGTPVIDAGVPDAGTPDAGPVCVPVTEVCDGVDNDCDGMVDENVTIACNPDADDDLYASSTVVTQLCAAPSRQFYGFCPTGYVAPTASKGLDCNPTDANRYRTESARADADSDSACTGAATNDCVGILSLPGRRLATACLAVDDCNDNNAAVNHLASSRTDADNDTACTGAATNDCVGAFALAGRRFTANCAATDDCNDNSATLSVPAVVLPDADGDGRCKNQLLNVCTDGTNAPAGTKFAAQCVTQDDCNDANGGIYRMASVRLDGDNDGYCLGQPTMQCIGATAGTGFRFPNDCAGVDDCRDTNPLANSACVVTGGYTTTSAVKACLFVPPTQSFTVSTTTICPLGFYLGSFAANKIAGNGSCSATSELTLSMTCNGLDGATCNIVGTCLAL